MSGFDWRIEEERRKKEAAKALHEKCEKVTKRLRGQYLLKKKSEHITGEKIKLEQNELF